MKDFAAQQSRKKSSRKKTKQSGGFGQLLWLVGLLLAGGLLAMMIAQSWRWADFVGERGQQAVLFTTEEVDQTGAYLVRFYFPDLAIEVFPIESETQTEVMGGYGTYRFQAVYPLLELENKDHSYIRSTMSLSTGMLLDELWVVNTDRLQINSQARLKQFLVTNLWRNWQVSLADKLAWLALAADHRTEFTLRQNVTELPDQRFLVKDFAQAEPLCTIALVNTTDMNGLAGRIAQLLESHNFRVVRTVSNDTTAEQTTAITQAEVSEDCQLVLDKVTSLVPGPVKQQVDEDEALRQRADLVVQLGTDLVQ